MNELQIFNNSEFGSIRTLEIDGEPWFVGKDIAEVLGYGNKNAKSKALSNALSDHVDEEDKKIIPYNEFKGYQNGDLKPISHYGATIINESGLYSLIMSSKLPSAKAFKRWVTSEVLPSIRKTGGYHVPQTYSQALRALADAEEQKERLALENAELKPKADFYDAVVDSKTAIDMGSVAKVLNMGIGRNTLFKILREKKILQWNNRPYQEYIDRGYFRCIESSYTKPNGDTCVTIKTVVFQKGVDFIRKVIDN